MAQRALVVGAGGAVGEAAAHALMDRGWSVRAALHAPRPRVRLRLEARGAECLTLDLDAPANAVAAARGCDVLLFTPNLPLVVKALAAFEAEDARILAFSSNNVAIHPDAPAYRSIAAAEAILRARHPNAVLVRPTMIYGDPRLATASSLVRAVRKLPVLPVPNAQARVQPVFFRDLAMAAVGLLERRLTGVFAIGGPEALSMHHFVSAIARAARTRCLVLPAPAPMLRLGKKVLRSRWPLSADQEARRAWDRLAVPQDPLPPELAPSTPLQAGLAHLVQAMDAPD